MTVAVVKRIIVIYPLTLPPPDINNGVKKLFKTCFWAFLTDINEGFVFRRKNMRFIKDVNVYPPPRVSLPNSPQGSLDT